MRLVVVDDEPAPIRIVQSSLRRAGYDVETYKNGKEALDAVLKSPPDVLITDIEMPVMTGQQLCESLQAQMPERAFPIYVVTSVADLIHRKWTTGIDDLHFLEKPISMRTLLAALEAHERGDR